MKKERYIQVDQYYLESLIYLVVLLYIGLFIVNLFKKYSEAQMLYREAQEDNNIPLEQIRKNIPSDQTDKRLQNSLDRYFGYSRFRIFKAALPWFSMSKQKYLQTIEDDVIHALDDDDLTSFFLKKRNIVNPLYLAYMRTVSRQIYTSFSSENEPNEPNVVFYPASSVDILTPLLLLMANRSSEITIYMVDNDPEILKNLKKINKKLLADDLSKTLSPKIIERMHKQFYLLSIYDHLNSNQRVSPHLILVLMLQQLGIKEITIKNNQLIFMLQNKRIVFQFITADIEKENELIKLPKIIAPYVYLEKARVGLSHADYLNNLFTVLGTPSFSFVSTEKLNPDFASKIWLWKVVTAQVPREKVLQTQFIPDIDSHLEKVKHPLLNFLHRTIIKISRNNEGLEVTDYHLPTLHTSKS